MPRGKPMSWKPSVQVPVQKPRESWWLGLSRDEFTAEAKRQKHDIESSNYGRKMRREWIQPK